MNVKVLSFVLSLFLVTSLSASDLVSFKKDRSYNCNKDNIGSTAFRIENAKLLKGKNDNGDDALLLMSTPLLFKCVMSSEGKPELESYYPETKAPALVLTYNKFFGFDYLVAPIDRDFKTLFVEVPLKDFLSKKQMRKYNEGTPVKKRFKIYIGQNGWGRHTDRFDDYVLSLSSVRIDFEVDMNKTEIEFETSIGN